MSFYGQVLYEFTKLFSKIKVGDNFLEADQAWDQIEIVPDAWISIDINDTDQNKKINFTHADPQEEDEEKSIPSFVLTDTIATVDAEVGADGDEVISDASAIQLMYDDGITVSEPKFDQKGHLIEVSTKNYIMPKQLIVQHATHADDYGIIVETIPSDEDNILRIVGDSFKFNEHCEGDDASWIKTVHYPNDANTLGIEHYTVKDHNKAKYNTESIFDANSPGRIDTVQGVKIVGAPQEDDVVIALNPGQYVTIPTIVYDHWGHVLGDKAQIYQLPITETDAALQDYNTRINGLEVRLNGAWVDNPLQDSAFAKTYEDFCKKIELACTTADNAATKEDVGTISETMESMQNITNIEAASNPYTVTNAILYLIQAIEERDTIIENLQKQHDTDVSGLSARLTLLISKLKELGVELGDTIT